MCSTNFDKVFTLFANDNHSITAPSFSNASDYSWTSSQIQVVLKMTASIDVNCTFYAVALRHWNFLKYSYIPLLGKNCFAVAVNEQSFSHLIEDKMSHCIRFPIPVQVVNGIRCIIVATSPKFLVINLPIRDKITLYCRETKSTVLKAKRRILKLLSRGLTGVADKCRVHIVGLQSVEETRCFLKEKFGTNELDNIDTVQMCLVQQFMPYVLHRFVPFKIVPRMPCVRVKFHSFTTPVHLVKQSPLLWNDRVLHFIHASTEELPIIETMRSSQIQCPSCKHSDFENNIQSGDSNICMHCGQICGPTRTMCRTSLKRSLRDDDTDRSQHGQAYDSRFSAQWNLTSITCRTKVLENIQELCTQIKATQLTTDKDKYQAFRSMDEIGTRFCIHTQITEHAKSIYSVVRDVAERLHATKSIIVACIYISLDTLIHTTSRDRHKCNEHFLLDSIASNNNQYPFKNPAWCKRRRIESSERRISINLPSENDIFHIDTIPYRIESTLFPDIWHLQQVPSTGQIQHLLITVKRCIFHGKIVKGDICVRTHVISESMRKRDRISTPQYTTMNTIRRHGNRLFAQWNHKMRFVVADDSPSIQFDILHSFNGRKVNIATLTTNLSKLGTQNAIKLDIREKHRKIGFLEVSSWKPSIRRVIGCSRTFANLYDKRIHTTQCPALDKFK